MVKATALLLLAAAATTAPPRDEAAASLQSPAALGAAPAGSVGLPPATPALAAASASSRARFPGFAARLAEQPVLGGPDAWPPLAYDQAWAALARSNPEDRQATRWTYARSLIGANLGDEAVGVLDVMKSDDPDLAMVPWWQLARGAALTQTGRYAEALDALGGGMLANNPEAALWRMRSMAGAGLAAQAMVQMPGALPALNARHGAQRSPFLLVASRAALAVGKPAQALAWLALLPDRDPAANLYRGRAYMALGQTDAGRLRLERVKLSGDAEQRIDAQLSLLEAAVANHTAVAADALKQLDHIRFVWRGGDIEQRALELTVQLSDQAHDTRHSLSAGAALFRYFNLGSKAAPTIAALQAQFAAALAPDSGMPLDQAAGLYWEFRDLAPSGAEGDLLVNRLADRLQAASLYGRAAELLQYQLTARAQDITQGPLSVRVASLYILAGRPDRALQAIRATAGNLYPDQMTWDRHRVEAAALHLLGKTNEALAVLQDVPDGNRIRSEIFWQKRDWMSLVATDEADLPKPGTLNDVEQTIVLRHAIGLAMLGREDAITRLRTRYAASFGTLPTAATFEVLTRPVGALDPSALSKAMASLPSASPAGSIGELFDAGTGAARMTGA